MVRCLIRPLSARQPAPSKCGRYSPKHPWRKIEAPDKKSGDYNIISDQKNSREDIYMNGRVGGRG